jgi:hypothetical protein
MIKSLSKYALVLALFSLILIPQLAGAVSLETGIGYGASIGLGSKDIRITIASILNVAMGLLGMIAVIIILLGGFKWMTAMGNDDKVKEARKLIVSGVIGLIIILTSYALATFVISSILNAT